MIRGPQEGRATMLIASGDRRRLAESTRRLGGFLDPEAFAQQAAREIDRLLGMPLTSVAVHEAPGLMVMLGVNGERTQRYRGVRISTGQGLGGRALVERRPIAVDDYLNDPAISQEFADVVRGEGIGGMIAVPVMHDSDVLGVLYGATRTVGSLGDRAMTLLQAAAADIAPVMSLTMRASQALSEQVHAERLRIASNLHDDVGQLLFSIGVAAAQMASAVTEGPLAESALHIEQQAQLATRRMREAFDALAPSDCHETIPVALRRELEDLGDRAGLATHLVVRGMPRVLPARVETALVAGVRQALFNIEQHAAANLVIVTLHFEEDRVTLVVQDDGQGLPDGFELQAIPRGEHNWGLTSLLRRVEHLGGVLEMTPNEDGGTTLRMTIPCTTPGN